MVAGLSVPLLTNESALLTPHPWLPWYISQPVPPLGSLTLLLSVLATHTILFVSLCIWNDITITHILTPRHQNTFVFARVFQKTPPHTNLHYAYILFIVATNPEVGPRRAPKTSSLWKLPKLLPLTNPVYNVLHCSPRLVWYIIHLGTTNTTSSTHLYQTFQFIRFRF